MASEITEAERRLGLKVAREQRVAVFIAGREAGERIGETLRRIPEELRAELDCIYLIDDSSSGATAHAARELRADFPGLEIFSTPYRQGYGGMQKLGYRYAMQRGCELVVLLRGDGSHPPEYLARMLAPFDESVPFDKERTAAVIGARWSGTSTGGVPRWKAVGNRLLTGIENRLLKSSFNDLHSGYRAYRVAALAELPLQHDSNGFAFEVEVVIQLMQRGRSIVEVPVSAQHGDEIGLGRALAYSFECLRTVLHARATRLYLAYHPKFDAHPDGAEYRFKHAPNTLHQHVVSAELEPGTRVLELGAGQGRLGDELTRGGARAVSVDLRLPREAVAQPFLELDLEGDFVAPAIEALGGRARRVIALDVLEHLADPERGLERVQRCLEPGGTLIASTGNVAYLPLRLALFAGRFNYGKMGILDMTHSRLFTVRSFARLLTTGGFRVDSVRGFGPPIEDMVGDGLPLRALDRVAGWMARLWPSLFGYQFLIEATRLDDLEDLLERTVASDRPEHADDEARA